MFWTFRTHFFIVFFLLIIDNSIKIGKKPCYLCHIYITWYTLYAYFISDFYIFCESAHENRLGQGCRPGILVYFYVQLGARVVRTFRARAQKVNFWGGQKPLFIERRSLFSKTINARIMIEVSLERATMSNENVF